MSEVFAASEDTSSDESQLQSASDHDNDQANDERRPQDEPDRLIDSENKHQSSQRSPGVDVRTRSTDLVPQRRLFASEDTLSLITLCFVFVILGILLRKLWFRD
jgi:hypothetical protein